MYIYTLHYGTRRYFWYLFDTILYVFQQICSISLIEDFYILMTMDDNDINLFKSKIYKTSINPSPFSI